MLHRVQDSGTGVQPFSTVTCRQSHGKWSKPGACGVINTVRWRLMQTHVHTSVWSLKPARPDTKLLLTFQCSEERVSSSLLILVSFSHVQTRRQTCLVLSSCWDHLVVTCVLHMKCPKEWHFCLETTRRNWNRPFCWTISHSRSKQSERKIPYAIHYIKTVSKKACLLGVL